MATVQSIVGEQLAELARGRGSPPLGFTNFFIQRFYKMEVFTTILER